MKTFTMATEAQLISHLASPDNNFFMMEHVMRQVEDCTDKVRAWASSGRRYIEEMRHDFIKPEFWEAYDKELTSLGYTITPDKDAPNVVRISW